jgi:centractin
VAFNIDKVDEELEVPYKLPDGNVIQVGAEKYRAPEVLFNPSLIGQEYVGMHQMLLDSIAKCDMDIRRNMFSNIILSGGSTMFDGLGDRLLSEVRKLAPRDTKIKIWAPPQRTMSTWLGGSILAGLSTFKKMWVTRKEYEEGGKNAVYRKTF